MEEDINEGKAYGRVGLLGNPSDIFGGMVISTTFDNSAIVRVRDSLEWKITGEGNDLTTNLGYEDGKHKLVKATIRILGLEKFPLEIDYHTDIPVGSGLAGSSAIIIALMRALNDKFTLEMDRYKIAELALRAEIDELGISAGPQDRYAISFEGVNYMDFSGKEMLRRDDPYGNIERVNVSEIPFFLCLGVQPKSSAIVHNPVRERFLFGKLQERIAIKENMLRIAELADIGKEALIKGDWARVGELMVRNTELREVFYSHRKKDKEIIERALDYGALGAKVAGSGGAVVILADNEDVMRRMQEHYPCMRPKIVG